MKLRKINKKSQEEMVGFMLIVVLIAVIGVIFLGITLRKPSQGIAHESDRVMSFLSALTKTSSDCEKDSIPLEINRLITKCEALDICDDKRPACEVLKNTLVNILEASYPAGDNNRYRYSNLKIYRSFDNSNIIEPILLGNGNACLGTKLFNKREFAVASGENVIMYLEICLND